MAAIDEDFDPNQLMQQFSERLRALEQPLDLSISLQRLRPAGVAAGPQRWDMQDISDVEDISEIRRKRDRQAKAELAAASLAKARTKLARALASLASREADRQATARQAAAEARASREAAARAERDQFLRSAMPRIMPMPLAQKPDVQIPLPAKPAAVNLPDLALLVKQITSPAAAPLPIALFLRAAEP
jgi:hypothetical protein